MISLMKMLRSPKIIFIVFFTSLQFIYIEQKIDIMEITDDKKIIEVQQEFHEKFPFLKIEFYKQAHKSGEGSRGEIQLDPYMTIQDARTDHSEGDLSIHANLKVETLEERFEEDYGLHVQVFRKSKQIWLQTTATDSWTLAEQNERGEQES